MPIYLKIAPINGQSTATGHDKELEIDQFSSGISLQMHGNAKSNNERTSGRSDVQAISCSRMMDSASPLIMEYCASAKDVDTAILTVERENAGQSLNIVTYTLSNVFFSSYSVGIGSTGDAHESFTLDFAKINVKYNAQSKDGTDLGAVVFDWDMTKNSTK